MEKKVVYSQLASKRQVTKTIQPLINKLLPNYMQVKIVCVTYNGMID